MNELLRIGFAVVAGVVATSLLEWLTHVPHNLDILLGIVAAFIAYWQAPGVFPRRPL